LYRLFSISSIIDLNVNFIHRIFEELIYLMLQSHHPQLLQKQS
jgi:hypothetical protein